MKAYGAKLGSVILPSTLHSHPRGAMVNYIYLYAGEVPMDSWTDETIRQKFLTLKESTNDLSIVEVDLKDYKEIDLSADNPIFF